MGEFAFIIAKTALDAGIVNHEFYTAVVFSALVSMILVPLLSGRSVEEYEFVKKHLPKSVARGADKLETARSDFYSRIVFSTKSVKRVRNRFTVVYAGTLVITVIEILFYLYGSTLGLYFTSYLGVSVRISGIIVLLLNLGALILPTTAIVVSLKVIDRMLVEGGKRKRGYYLEDDADARSAYSRFVGISNILLILAIDFIIMLIIPNPLPLGDHLIIMITGLVTLLAVYLYRYARKS